MAKCGVANPLVTWDAIFLWSRQNMRGKSLHVTARKLCFATVVYNLCLHRNALLHGCSPQSEEGLLSNIRWEVKVRLITKFYSK
jgi:hypothetical protein